jgi:hypothetical protein
MRGGMPKIDNGHHGLGFSSSRLHESPSGGLPTVRDAPLAAVSRRGQPDDARTLDHAVGMGPFSGGARERSSYSDEKDPDSAGATPRAPATAGGIAGSNRRTGRKPRSDFETFRGGSSSIPRTPVAETPGKLSTRDLDFDSGTPGHARKRVGMRSDASSVTGGERARWVCLLGLLDTSLDGKVPEALMNRGISTVSTVLRPNTGGKLYVQLGNSRLASQAVSLGSWTVEGSLGMMVTTPTSVACVDIDEEDWGWIRRHHQSSEASKTPWSGGRSSRFGVSAMYQRTAGSSMHRSGAK